MAYTDELDEIRSDASRARVMREGVPGADAGKAELQQRLDPGARMRAAAGPDYTGVPSTGPAPSMAEMRQTVGMEPSPAKVQAYDALRTAAPADATEVTSRLRPAPAPVAAPAAATPMGVVGNRSTGGRAAMSPEATEWLAQRAASAAPAAAPAAAETAGDAMRTVAKSGVISKLGRAVPIVGTAAGVAGEALNVKEVYDNPKATAGDVATQTMEGVARLAGGTVGGIAGGATLGPVGAVGGAVAGYKIADEGIKQLRAMVGLDPRSPVDRLAPQPPAPPAQPAASATAANDQRPLSAAPASAQRPVQSVTSTASAPTPARTMAQAAQAPAEPKYTLGENAVEVIRPGGVRTVETFGANGNEGAVPSEVFQQGRTGEYRRTMQDAAMANMSDPERRIATQRVANEGGVERERIQQSGEDARNTARINAPVVVQPRANPAAGLPGQPSVIDGMIVHPVTGETRPLGAGKPSRQQVMNSAQAAIAAGAKPADVEARLTQSLGSSFRFDPKSKTFREVSAQQ
jgi:hypothetical protein